VTTTLIAGAQAPGERATWLTLLSYDRRLNEGAVVYVPAHTAVEVPGRGLQGVGDSLSDGDIELLVLSAKSLLNVQIDHYLELTPEDTQSLFSGIGPLTVEVPDEVRVSAGKGTARLLFPQGSQELTSDRIAQLLFTTGLDGDELDLGPRHLAVWDALLDAYENDPRALAAALGNAGDIGRADTDLSDHVEVIASVAGAGSQARNLSVLPVAPVSVGDSELYTIDEAELGEFMRTTAHAEAPLHDEVRVQVLNGNGFPGIGQEVADRLVGDGFRVVLSGNARSLDHDSTLVVTYDATPEGLELAQRARDLIGVGEVQVSRLDQGIVDLTIVVGKDFLRKP
jgi:LytR cell envelope-related transcriptional attenuator